MRNFYSCGCYVADDVPVISRCAQHNGWVVCRTNYRVTHPRQLLVGSKVKILHHNLYDVLPHLRRQVDLIFAYPEYDLFAVAHQLSPFGFASQRMEIFEHVQRLLKPEGKAVFIIDPVDLGTMLYQAKLHGFKTYTRFTPVFIKPETLWSKSAEQSISKVYKVAVGLNTGPLPRIRLTDLKPLFDGLGVPDDARILDTSCIFLDRVQAARPESKIVGIVEDASRYQRFLPPASVGAGAASPQVSRSPGQKRKARSGKRSDH